MARNRRIADTVRDYLGGRPSESSQYRREQAVRELVAKLGGDPLVKLVELHNAPGATDEFRRDCLKILLPYVHAQRKDVDIGAKDGSEVQVTVKTVKQQ